MSDDSDFEKSIDPNVTIVDTGSKTFDINAGKTWIYPINFPVRDYQFSIIQNALFHNTMVSLPTGLGKTFIAAVVMYNFYRWYPRGKILFLAPTRPLVKQQMDACYNITAIPKNTTAELTGNIERKSREVLWKNKRVFFITPQVLQNDLETVENLGGNIRCIVFDEAHKARGNHAYAEVIKKLVNINDFFRVLALSATPGKDISDVATVIQNLLISHLEFRTEESSDVQNYIFQRTMETLVVPLDDKILEVKKAYLNILECYTRRLMKYKIIQGNCNTLTKGKLFMTLKDFQVKNYTNRHPNYSEILKNLNVCITLYHAYELLIRHGLRSFIYYFEEHLDKPLLKGNETLKEIVKNVKNYLNSTDELGGSCVVRNMKVGHPKFLKLREILLAHFTEKKEETRVIVFFEYRESAKEACSILSKDEPLIRSRMLLGQGSGIPQKEQFTVLKAFKEGKCNTLLSTSIGEEGLDVGEVDLIICFDVSNRSPIRMIQRIGRTGRKKNGHIIILVTQGREQQTLSECLQYKKHIPTNISSLSSVSNILYTKCPRMIPDDISPNCEKVYFTVKKPAAQTKKSTLVDMFQPKYDPCLENIDGINESITVQLQSSKESLWNNSCPLKSESQFIIPCSNHDALRRLQFYSEIGHSTTSQLLVSLLQFADCIRFNIPMTNLLPQKRTLVQGDIRDIFKQSHNVITNRIMPPIDICCNNIAGQNTSEDSISEETSSEIQQFLNIRTSLQNTVNWFQPLMKYFGTCVSNNVNLSTWVQPNVSVLLKPNRNYFLKLMENEHKFQIEGERKNTYTHCIQYADKTLNETTDTRLTEILNFFKLVNLWDIFVISKEDVGGHEENDKAVNTADINSESTELAKFKFASRIKDNKYELDDHHQTSLNSSKKVMSSFEFSQDDLCQLNDFVNLEDMFDTSNTLPSIPKNAGSVSKVFKNDLELKSLCHHVHNPESPFSTGYLANDNICQFSHSGISGCNVRKRKNCTEDELDFVNGDYLNNLRSNSVVTPVIDIDSPCKPKKSYISANPSSLTIENDINNYPNEESQMSISQIFTLLNKKEQTAITNHDNINYMSNIHHHDKDHFEDLLDKMV